MVTAEQALKEVKEYMLLQAQSGVTYKNIKRGLISKGVSEELANKLMRLLELQHGDFK